MQLAERATPDWEGEWGGGGGARQREEGREEGRGGGRRGSVSQSEPFPCAIWRPLPVDSIRTDLEDAQSVRDGNWIEVIA